MVEKKEKIELYFLGIVGLVAFVGLITLFMNTGRLSLDSTDLSGQVVLAKEAVKEPLSFLCTDSDTGGGNFHTYTTKGTVKGGKSTVIDDYDGELGETDFCYVSRLSDETTLLAEYYCIDSLAYYKIVDCLEVAGSDYVCYDGRCLKSV